ncbi:leucine rich repeat containing 72 [Perkinsus olseni]|uniref:Leucine rich repeat containing 72 n=2 Tax=Perkinsus olseni TaxID=32597 RepID=A0A7J6SDB8_PEROL|nr:leucine rich repeat containing 72 [Perkinsus olseni]
MSDVSDRQENEEKETNNPTTSVELNPWKCIANKTRKGARECTELYLCEEAGEDISSEIDKFPNVEVMWIEGNRLSSLLRLRTHSRLQEIYASNNCLTSLQGIEGCKFLRKLIVSSNRLEDLSKQLQFLSKFSFLASLELDDNPCAREEKYRQRCIASLSSLAVLDCSPITLRERDLREQQQQQPSASKRRVSLSEIIQPSISETEAFAEADKIRVRWARREEAAAVAGWGLVSPPRSDKPIEFPASCGNVDMQLVRDRREASAYSSLTPWEASLRTSCFGVIIFG